MEEEFHESDVIWLGHHHHRYRIEDHQTTNIDDYSYSYRKIVIPSQQLQINTVMKMKKNSLPVDIPENIPGRSWFHSVDSDNDDYHDGEMVPPHVMVARRIAGKMAFSVCTGNGRTLKGRDLRQVRNSILRMTGFLET